MIEVIISHPSKYFLLSNASGRTTEMKEIKEDAVSGKDFHVVLVVIKKSVFFLCIKYSCQFSFFLLSPIVLD